MTLVSKAPEGETSPFHLVHERVALEWQAFARSIDALITGSYDPWHVEVQIKSAGFVMKGERHLMTRRGPLIEMGSPYQERVTIKWTLSTYMEDGLSIVKDRTWNWLPRMLRYQKLQKYLGYSYRGPTEWVDHADDLVTILINAKLGSLHLRGTSLDLELSELPKQREQLSLIYQRLHAAIS